LSESIEVLVDEIRRRAEQKIDEILRNAKKEAEEMIEEAKRKVDNLFKDKAKGEITLLRRKIIGQTELQGRFELLKAKDEVIKKVEDVALEEIKRIISGEKSNYDYYNDILYKLVKEAVERIDEEDITIEANKRDKEFLSKKLDDWNKRLSKDLSRNVKLKLGNEPLNTIGGIVAKNKDGTKVYHNTIEGRFLKKERTLREKIGEILFPKRM